MITVTAATGQLGRLVIDELLNQVPAGDIVAAVRNPDKAADLAARGVQVRLADYDRPETLASALAGTDRLLLISSSEIGHRTAQHSAVVDAAVAAGVGRILYTSVLGAPDSPLGLAVEHRATEAAIAASGLPYTLLRNGWYTENYAAAVPQALATGVVIGSARDGRVASATRADYAAAAVAALLRSEADDAVIYELSGDRAWDFPELARELSAAAGRTIVYQDLSPAEHRQVLVGAGLPEPVADLLVDIDQGVAAGAVAATPGDLAKLIGRPTTPLATTLAQLIGTI